MHCPLHIPHDLSEVEWIAELATTTVHLETSQRSFEDWAIAEEAQAKQMLVATAIEAVPGTIGRPALAPMFPE